MLAFLSLPQTRPGPIAQLTHALCAAHVLLVVLDVGQATHSSHACAIECELSFRGQLDDDLVIEFTQNGTKCARGMD